MTTITSTPTNINPLNPNGYRFVIQKLPALTYFSQQVNLPGITLGEPEFANPFASVPVPGDRLTYDALTLEFLVDEDMKNYLAVHNWIVALGFPQTYQQYINFTNQDDISTLNELATNYSDGTLQILGNSNIVSKTVQFIDLFPTSLESLTFQSTSTDVNYLVGRATFRFSYYEFVTT
jgi:hypothetical protein